MAYYQSYQLGIGPAYFGACDQTSMIYPPTDSGDRIISKELQIVACGAGGCDLATINDGTILCTEDQSWNCNLCGNDLPFYIPIGREDYFQFQFQQIDPFNGIRWLFNPTYGQYGWTTVMDAYVRDCCTGNYILDGSGNPKSAANYISGNYSLFGAYVTTNWQNIAQTTNIQQFQFYSNGIWNDLSTQYNSDCFYFEFRFYDTTGGYTTLYTEPYKFVYCKNTLYISGAYNSKDCNGYYYGTDFKYNPGISFPFAYNNARRFYASLERIGFSIEKELVGNTLKTTSTTVTEKFLLRTERLSERMAMYLVNLLASEQVMIDGEIYVCDGDINKNNEVGNQWFIEASLRKQNCNKKFGNCK